MPPGKEGKIVLAVEHTEGYSGEIAKSASVTTNDPTNSTFNLVLRAHFKYEPPPGSGVVPNAAPMGKLTGPFTVSPSDRWTSSVISGSSATSRLYLYNREASPIHVTKVVTEGNDFMASMQTIQDGKRYELILSTNPNLAVGHHAQTIKLLTDNAENPEVPIHAEVNVFPKVFATPSTITLPRVALAADPASINLPVIYVRKLREGGLKIKAVSSTIPFITLALGTQSEGQVYTVSMKYDKSKLPSPGEYRGKIVIETNDLESPVIEVPVQGSFIR